MPETEEEDPDDLLFVQRVCRLVTNMQHPHPYRSRLAAQKYHELIRLPLDPNAVQSACMFE